MNHISIINRSIGGNSMRMSDEDLSLAQEGYDNGYADAMQEAEKKIKNLTEGTTVLTNRVIALEEVNKKLRNILEDIKAMIEDDCLDESITYNFIVNVLEETK